MKTKRTRAQSIEELIEPGYTGTPRTTPRLILVVGSAIGRSPEVEGVATIHARPLPGRAAVVTTIVGGVRRPPERIEMPDTSSPVETVLAAFEHALAALDLTKVSEVRLVSRERVFARYIDEGWMVRSVPVLRRLRALHALVGCPPEHDYLYRTAVHEAGHALAALLYADPFEVASIRRTRRLAGYVTHGDIGPQIRRVGGGHATLARVFVCVSGAAAETAMFGAYASGCGGDFRNARQLIAKLDRSGLEVPFLNHPEWGERELLLTESYRMMCDTFRSPAPLTALKVFADALITREVLTADELRELLGVPAETGVGAPGSGADACPASNG